MFLQVLIPKSTVNTEKLKSDNTELKQVFHSSNYGEIQPRWQRITPQPRDSRARSSSVQRDYRYIVRPSLRCMKTTNFGIIVPTYSTANTYESFVTELSNGSTIIDELQQDAENYVAYRYALADLDEVPLDSVKAEFATNPVLVGVMADEAPEPDPDALTEILVNNFADVISVAESNGQETALTTSVRDAFSLNAGPIDVAFKPDYMRTTYILNHQRQYLAEHHIYGSSRLGIQKYLPDGAQYHFKRGESGSGITNTLATTRPWYSLYGNDLFKPTVYSNDLDTLNMGTQGMGINSHILGKRQYELTNHLGNVQATVLDRATPILDNDTLVTGYKADISLAHDYYPFGMLMPGRYVSDTAQKCVTINTTVLVPVIIKVYLESDGPISYKNGDPNTVPVHNLPVALLAKDEHPYVYHYNDASSHPEGEVVSAEIVEGRAEYSISLSEEPSGGVTAFFIIHPDTNVTNQEVGFDLDIPDDVYAEVRVRQYHGSTGEEYDEALGWMAIDMSGGQQLSVPMNKTAINAGGKTILELRFNSASAADFPGDVITGVRNFYYKITHYEPQTRIATICDEKDNYRFSFQGIEKVNEVAGIGNHLTALYGEYSTRLGSGGRWNRDPKPNPSISPYAVFRNNPIWHSDVLLDTTYRFNLSGIFLEAADLHQKGILGSYGEFQTLTNDDGTEIQQWNGTYFSFNDVDVDRNQLQRMKIGEKRLQLVSDGEINYMMNQSDVHSRNPLSRLYYTADESRSGKLMDFTSQYLGGSAPETIGGFYIFGDEKRAYNTSDAGNFLWGHAMKRLGFDIPATQGGGHLYEILWHERKDAPGDQRAIKAGHSYKSNDNSWWNSTQTKTFTNQNPH